MVKKLTPPYRSSTGTWLTRSLFYRVPADPVVRDDAIFHLYKTETPGKINALESFVALGDPTGYEWAMKYLGNYQHFEQMMKQCPWFRDWFNTACSELHAKMRAQALRNVADIAINGTSDAQRLAASKYMAERPYEKVEKAKRGRPSKAEKAGHLKELEDLDKETKADFERIGLKVVQGGKKKDAN